MFDSAFLTHIAMVIILNLKGIEWHMRVRSRGRQKSTLRPRWELARDAAAVLLLLETAKVAGLSLPVVPLEESVSERQV